MTTEDTLKPEGKQMTTGADNRIESLRDLVCRNRQRGIPTHVHVQGDFSQTPPVGRDTAERVAELLRGRERAIREPPLEKVNDGDVVLVTISDPPTDSYEKRQELRKLTSISRVKELAGIVVFAGEISTHTENHLDARVCANSGDVDDVYRIEHDPYSADTYQLELRWGEDRE